MIIPPETPEFPPLLTAIWTRPRSAVPTPSVTTRSWPRWRLLISPLSAPTPAAAQRMTRTARADDQPRLNSFTIPMFAAPMTKAIERSRPPISAQSVWPIEAIPRNEAKTRFCRRLSNDQKPSIVVAPKMMSATRMTPDIARFRYCVATARAPVRLTVTLLICVPSLALCAAAAPPDPRARRRRAARGRARHRW